MSGISPDHPIEQFLFFVDDLFDPKHADALRSLVSELAKERSWVIGPPRFVYQAEELPAGASSGDQRARLLGGALRLYSALPPWGASLPRDVDREHYLEVAHLILRLGDFARETVT